MKYQISRVTFRFTEPILGTVPKDKEIYGTYIASKAPEGKDTSDEMESVDQLEERGWTGFHTENDRPFVYDYYVKGHLKDVGNVLKDQLHVTNLKSKVENYVFVKPRKIFFEAQPGKKLIEGVNERPLRAMTMQGPRVSLARSDTLENAQISCEIWVLENKEVTWKLVSQLLEYGTLRGMGQWRNGGWGRYEAVILA